MKRFAYGLSLIAAWALAPSVALAYGGPGAGLSALGSLVALLAAIGLTIVGFVWYPLRRLLRKMWPAEPKRQE